MSFTTPEPTLPATAGAATSQPLISKGLKIATIIFALLAVIGLIPTLILLFAAVANSTNEEFGWFFGFSVTASIINVIPAVVALILGIIGVRTKSRVSLAAVIAGASVLVVLVGQFVYLQMV